MPLDDAACRAQGLPCAKGVAVPYFMWDQALQRLLRRRQYLGEDVDRYVAKVIEIMKKTPTSLPPGQFEPLDVTQYELAQAAANVRGMPKPDDPSVLWQSYRNALIAATYTDVLSNTVNDCLRDACVIIDTHIKYLLGPEEQIRRKVWRQVHSHVVAEARRLHSTFSLSAETNPQGPEDLYPFPVHAAKERPYDAEHEMLMEILNNQVARQRLIQRLEKNGSEASKDMFLYLDSLRAAPAPVDDEDLYS